MHAHLLQMICIKYFQHTITGRDSRLLCSNVGTQYELRPSVDKVIVGLYSELASCSIGDSAQEQRNYSAILGALWSEVSIVVSALAPQVGMPVLSTGSTAPVFSNKDLHPLFSRTISTQLLNLPPMIRLLNAFNWRRIGIVFEDNESTTEVSLERVSSIENKLVTDLCVVPHRLPRGLPHWLPMPDLRLERYFLIKNQSSDKIFCQMCFS